MHRCALVLPIALTACVSTPVPVPPPAKVLASPAEAEPKQASLPLQRRWTVASAIRFVQENVRVGDSEADAVGKLQRGGFGCGSPDLKYEVRQPGVRLVTCYVASDRTVSGYNLVYANVAIDDRQRLTLVKAGTYPVVFNNLRIDEQGRTIVVPDPSQWTPPAPLHTANASHDARRDDPARAGLLLQGRWTITSVNGKKRSGLWLNLGGEGRGTLTKTANGVLVGSPQPRTQAYLGCNDWHPNGWTQNGDKLILSAEMSLRTERGCDAARLAIDDQAYAVLTRPMTMKLTPPGNLRLDNKYGILDLVRDKD